MIYLFDEVRYVSYETYCFMKKYNLNMCCNSYRPYIRYSDRLKHEIAIYLMQLICNWMGHEEWIPTFSYDMRGAPMLCGQFISISHSQDTVVVAVDDSDIGIDVEYFTSNYIETATVLTFPKEKKVDDVCTRMIFALNAKEALGKCKHIGLDEEIMKLDFSEYFGRKEFNAFDMLFQYFMFDEYSIVSCCNNWQEIIKINYGELKKSFKR